MKSNLYLMGENLNLSSQSYIATLVTPEGIFKVTRYKRAYLNNITSRNIMSILIRDNNRFLKMSSVWCF